MQFYAVRLDGFANFCAIFCYRRIFVRYFAYISFPNFVILTNASGLTLSIKSDKLSPTSHQNAMTKSSKHRDPFYSELPGGARQRKAEAELPFRAAPLNRQ